MKSLTQYMQEKFIIKKSKIIEELHNNFLTKRLINAFPHAKDKSHKFKDIRKEFIAKAKEIRRLKQEQRRK